MYLNKCYPMKGTRDLGNFPPFIFVDLSKFFLETFLIFFKTLNWEANVIVGVKYLFRHLLPPFIGSDRLDPHIL